MVRDAIASLGIPLRLHYHSGQGRRPMQGDMPMMQTIAAFATLWHRPVVLN